MNVKENIYSDFELFWVWRKKCSIHSNGFRKLSFNIFGEYSFIKFEEKERIKIISCQKCFEVFQYYKEGRIS